ncbi:hypothetical protein [Flavilitoribacter nigricans]|uniref:Polysaccharide (De)acetylase n=1 Tax=Flavilitoribacter nigricans (strain ATCC 23147 / DSM 23189 / NBRC 102662 / NCIMB 1420 / SS-2) TaxID=1122177 RepID=A0A2D0N010_FLAN2|nr:hypothetical protein [Flavilitoribacter nigricans]PHN01489.1 hypothetical protein CRP01_36930 [Flavilitoribacter nigricans DSM 23189 = NBRC 102662]
MIKKHLINILGWKTDRKIVVFESDDWGAIRMPSKAVFNSLKKKGYPLENCPYNNFDSLESNKDLECLFDVLDSVKDKNGQSSIFTLNNIVANPNFEKIKESDFQSYYFEPFIDTLNRYPSHDKVYELYQKGIEEKLIKPQFHGREHLQVNRWIDALQRKEVPVLDAFQHNFFSPKIRYSHDYPMEYMDALDYDSIDELTGQKKIVSEGLKLFKDIWSFSSKSFIAPCYTWDSQLEECLLENGVHYLQGVVAQQIPTAQSGYDRKLKFHYQGQKNQLGQRYLVRNAFFEPTLYPQKDWVGECMKRISIAFKWKKPAIIGSHRLNYTGSLDPKNRDTNLRGLRSLLDEIVKLWPSVEFYSSDQLGLEMDKKKEAFTHNANLNE